VNVRWTTNIDSDCPRDDISLTASR
jgi:hypothetical protein